MTEVHALPLPILAKEWEDVDTSIDSETPALLSDEQFDRYTETVAALLRAQGLRVTVAEGQPGQIEIVQPGTGLCIELDLREDRSAEWSFSGGDECEPGNTALQTAALVNRLLPCRNSENR